MQADVSNAHLPTKKEEENRGIDPITDRERGLVLLDQIKNSLFTVTDVTKKEGTGVCGVRSQMLI